MIINKDGKLFGKISIVDIAVILIVALLAVGMYFRFSGNSKVIVSGGQKIECTLLVKNVREYTVEALEKSTDLYDAVSKEYIGTITDVRREDGMYLVNKIDGSYTQAVPEDRYNLYLTIEFTGKAGDSGYYTDANKHLGVGTNVSFTTKYSSCGASVYSIGIKK